RWREALGEDGAARLLSALAADPHVAGPRPGGDGVEREGAIAAQALLDAPPGVALGVGGDGLHEDVHAPVAAEPEPPHLGVVGARLVVAEGGPSRAQRLARHQAHVLFEASAAHAAAAGPILLDQEARAGAAGGRP